MNLYHRYIKVPFVYEKPSIFDGQSDTFIDYVAKEHIKPELLIWLKEFNIKISNVVESFYTSKENKVTVPIHNDMTIKPGTNDAVKLNFTWGPTDSTTRWWKVKDESKLIEIIHDQSGYNDAFKAVGIEPDIDCHKCYTAKEHDLEMVYEKVIDKPSLLNVGQLHSTYNPSPTLDRWTLSFTLLHEDNSHVSFSEALEIFSGLTDE